MKSGMKEKASIIERGPISKMRMAGTIAKRKRPPIYRSVTISRTAPRTTLFCANGGWTVEETSTR